MRINKLVLSIFLLAWLAGIYGAALSISPNPQSAALGQPFVVSVNLDTATQIRGCSVRIQYDPSYLSYSSAARGTMFTGQNVGWWRTFNGSPDEDPGVLRVECIIFGAGLYVTGPGNLLNITFNSVAEGFSELTFLQATIYDPLGNVIAETTGSNADVIIGSNFVYTKAKAWLEGPYSLGAMATSINSILPLSSPYPSAPLTTEAIPAEAVDWVLVELRSLATGLAVQAQSAFIFADGYIRSVGKPYLIFFSASPGNYYLVISHRNHLSVMSQVPLNLLGSGALPVCDFSVLANIYGQGGVKQVSPGVYAMAAGDANHNNNIAPSDRNLHWRPQTGQSGYKSADFNLNGNVSPSDLNRFWRLNSGLGSSVP